MTFDIIVPLLVSAAIGYVFGSIPSGFLVVKLLTGQDVRTVGSGRTGGTNVLRAAGRKAFILTVLSDIAKGFVGTLIVRLLFASQTQNAIGTTPLWDVAQCTAGLAAIAGNNWSLFLRGHGGAGVMTMTGTMLVIAP